MDWADSVYCKPVMLRCLSNPKIYFHRFIELAIPFECANNNVTGDIVITATATTTCLIKGTKVLLANGKYKNIEDIDLSRIYSSFDSFYDILCFTEKGRNNILSSFKNSRVLI